MHSLEAPSYFHPLGVSIHPLDHLIYLVQESKWNYHRHLMEEFVTHMQQMMQAGRSPKDYNVAFEAL